MQEFLAPSKNRGRRECRMLDAPAASRAIKKKRTRTYKVHRNHAGIPCAMVLRLLRALPGVPGFLATIACGNRFPQT
jgi:hypothetical protein